MHNKLTKKLNFIHSEKATNFCDIFPLLLSYVVPVESKVEISQKFVAFSEYMNFKKNTAKIGALYEPSEGSRARLVHVSLEEKDCVHTYLKNINIGFEESHQLFTFHLISRYFLDLNFAWRK